MPQNAITAFANLLRKTAEAEEKAAADLLPHFKTVATKVGDIKSDYEATEIAAKNRFNVFDVLTRHHLEELHSNFIAYLLNPIEKHDFGSDFLAFFIEILNENLDFEQKINDFDYKKAQIYKEHPTNYGRLDIFVTTTNFNLIIENKIYANEQDEQIPRYVAFGEKLEKPFLVVYLTPEGDASATGAAGTYLPISYRNDILEWLERCLAHTKNFSLAHAGIYFYTKTLQQKILHITDNQIIMDIKTLFKTNDDAKEILKHWGEIQPAVEAYGAELKLFFFTKVYRILQKNYKLSLYKEYENYSLTSFSSISDILNIEKKIEGQGLKFEDTNLMFKLPNKRIAYFYIEHNYEDVYFGLAGFDKSNDKIILEKVTNSIKNKIGNSFENTNSNIFKPNNISFLSQQNIYHLATNMDALVAQFVTEVEQFLTAWRETIDELNKGK